MIEIGRVVGTHGVRGELKVRPHNRDTEALAPGVGVRLEGRAGAREAEIVAARPHGTNLLLRLSDVDTMTDAEAVVGSRVLVPREALPAPAEGEFYWFEVIGLEAVTEDGRRLGRVAEILEGPAHDIYVVRDGARERLLPAVDDVVAAIEPAAGRVVVRAIQDLDEL
jgi:16S rRNA processing protein RimM